MTRPLSLRTRLGLRLPLFLALLGTARTTEAQPMPGDAPARFAQAIVEVRAGDLATTGVLTGRWNTVVTTANALGGAPRGPLRVRFRDGVECRGSVVALRPDLDLAVVEIPPVGGSHSPLLLGGGEALRAGVTLFAPPAHRVGATTDTVATLRLRGLVGGEQTLPALDLAVEGAAVEPGAPLVGADGRLRGLVLHAGTEDGARGLGVEAIRAVLDGSAPAWPRPTPPLSPPLPAEHVALAALGLLTLAFGALALRRRRAPAEAFRVVATPAAPGVVFVPGAQAKAQQPPARTFTVIGPETP